MGGVWEFIAMFADAYDIYIRDNDTSYNHKRNEINIQRGEIVYP